MEAEKNRLSGLFELQSNKIQGGLFFACGFLAIVFQGCFTYPQILIFGGVLMTMSVLTKPSKIKHCLPPVFLIVCFIALSPLFTKSTYAASSAELFRWILLIFAGICFTSKYKKAFALGVYFGISLCALLGITAYFKIIPAEYFGTVQLAAEVDGVFQLFSVFGYSNTAAVFFGSAVFMGLNFFEQKALPSQFALLIALNVFAMYLTRSTFAFICFMVGVAGFYALKHGKTKWFFLVTFLLALAAVVVMALVPIIPGSTVISRIIYAQDALKVFTPMGIGFGQWANVKYSVQSAVYSTDYLHNGYLQLLIEGGIHIFLLFTAFIFLLLKGLIKSKNAAVFGMALFILLHAFVDIDMTYGALYILLGYCVSFDSVSRVTKKAFKPLSVLLSVVLVLVAGFGLYDYYTPPSSDYFENRLKSGTITVSELSTLFKGAKSVHDAESMYYFSGLWLDAAPKSQEAFSAVYESIDKIYAATLDENYLTVSRPALYKRMEIANSSMNKLCKYLDKNKCIELP